MSMHYLVNCCICDLLGSGSGSYLGLEKEERRPNVRKSEAAAGVEGPAVHRRDAPVLPGSILNSWAIATLLQETVGEVYYIY